MQRGDQVDEVLALALGRCRGPRELVLHGMDDRLTADEFKPIPSAGVPKLRPSGVRAVGFSWDMLRPSGSPLLAASSARLSSTRPEDAESETWFKDNAREVPNSGCSPVQWPDEEDDGSESALGILLNQGDRPPRHPEIEHHAFRARRDHFAAEEPRDRWTRGCPQASRRWTPRSGCSGTS